MTLDEVSSQAVAYFERSLEVDPFAGLPVTQVGSGKRLWSGLNIKLDAWNRNDREAATVDRHALAQFQRVAGRSVRAKRSSVGGLPASRSTLSIRPSPSTNPVNTAAILPVWLDQHYGSTVRSGLESNAPATTDN